MKTTEFNRSITSSKLRENFGKQFGSKVNLEKYDREQLEDIRNKLRTRIFQQEGAAGFNDLLTNETYQKDKAMLELLNTRIKEMLGEQMQKLRDKMDAINENKKDVKTTKKPKGSKPDFLDLDKDGNKTEPMKSAAKTAKSMKEAAKPDYIDLDKDGNKKETMKKAAKDAKAGKSFQEAMKKTCCCSTKGKEKCPVHGMKEGFPTVADAKKAHAEKTGTGKFDKKETDKGVHYTKKDTAGGTEDPRRPAKTMTSKKTGKPMAEGSKECANGHTKMTKGCDECSGMWESDFSKLEKKLSHQKGVTNPAGLAAKIGRDKYGKKGMEKKAAAGRKKANESMFKHNVRFVNESINFLLQEDEEGKAKAITAAGDIVNDYTSWMQRVGQYQTKSMIELADAIRADFGAAEAEAFKNSVGPALSATLDVLTQQREAVSNAVATLAGEAAPETPMGMEPDMGMDGGTEPGMDMSAPDEMNPEPAGDEFGASDAAAGGSTTSGREMRENAQQRRARKLAESHSIMAKLAK